MSCSSSAEPEMDMYLAQLSPLFTVIHLSEPPFRAPLPLPTTDSFQSRPRSGHGEARPPAAPAPPLPRHRVGPRPRCAWPRRRRGAGGRVEPDPGRDRRAHPGARRVGAAAGAAGEAGQRQAAVPPRGARGAAGGVRDELPPVRRRGGPLGAERAVRGRRVRAGLDQHPPAHLLQAGGPRPLMARPSAAADSDRPVTTPLISFRG
uniref:Uncharacterized protein n=1 Tax=Arundo donax TaxID=35708 RepID=A0A0A9CYL4_ARUDO